MNTDVISISAQIRYRSLKFGWGCSSRCQRFLPFKVPAEPILACFMEGQKLMPLGGRSGSLTKLPKTSKTFGLLCHLSVEIAMTPTARRLRRQGLASEYDLTPLLCGSSKLPTPKMITHHPSRDIHADSPSPPSSWRAKKILKMRFHHRLYGSQVTFLEGQPGRPQKRVPKKARAGSERFRSERQFDWIGCGDFVPNSIDVVRSDKDRARSPRGWHIAISDFVHILLNR